MLDFKEQNDIERKYFERDFSSVDMLMNKLRTSLITGQKLDLSYLNFDGVIDFIPSETLIYVKLYQAGRKYIRYGSAKTKTSPNITLKMRITAG